MSKSLSEIESAVDALVETGPEYDYDISKRDWENWLLTLAPEDFEALLECCKSTMRRIGRFDTSNPWLNAHLVCFKEVARNAPELFLHHAAAHQGTVFRVLFISQAGCLFNDLAVDWLDSLPLEELDRDEIDQFAFSYYEIGLERGVAGLDRLLASPRGKLPPHGVKLRDLRATLSRGLEVQ